MHMYPHLGYVPTKPITIGASLWEGIFFLNNGLASDAKEAA